MPSKKQYNLVHNDEYDTRIPLHSEEAFHRGIVFHAKFIGSMEVPRPTSRMEIVAAMRRIRYEFKAKGIKKKKVTLEVSVDGLKVTLRKKKFPILQKKQHWLDESKLELMHHPIYRIFYVSHDSHDLKIFSYIARDGIGSFRCNVFKSSKKSQAMRVVRTVGQAFEVCHKLSLNNPPEGGGVGGDDHQQQCNDKDRIGGDGENHRRDTGDDYDDRDEFASLQPQPSPSSLHKDISLLGDAEDSILDQPCPLRSHHHEVTTAVATTTCPPSPIRQSPLGNAITDQLMNSELTALKHEIQLLRERLDQQSQQTRAAVAHARLLQDQLAAETAARVEAQARTHQLLVQNKELLEHIAALVSHLREHERISGVPLSGQPGQVTSSGAISQSTTVADIAGLGQYNSAWDTHSSTTCCPHQHLYSVPPPLDPYFTFGHHHHQQQQQQACNSPAHGFATRGPPSCNGYGAGADDLLRYQQAQLWDSLRAGAVSPYVPQSMYPATPPTPTTMAPPAATVGHCYGPGFSLPPSGRPRSAQPPLPTSPSSTLPRPSSRVPRSPTYQQRSSIPLSPRSRSLERSLNNSVDLAPQEPAFIKPLPCGRCNQPQPQPAKPVPPKTNCSSSNSNSSAGHNSNNLNDLLRPLVLDPPPVGWKSSTVYNGSEPLQHQLSRAVQTDQNNTTCPLILLTESRSAGDSMPKIDESEDAEEEEIVVQVHVDGRRDSGPELLIPMRRNSQ